MQASKSTGCFAFWCGSCFPEEQQQRPHESTKGRRNNSPFTDWRAHPTVKAYRLVKLLGQGGFSEIWHGVDSQTGKQVAIKVVDLACHDMDDVTLELLENEAKFLRLLDCPHIIKCHQVLVTRNHLIMILEYLSGGEMLDKIHSIKHYSEAQAAKLFAQVLVAVKYMHNLSIIHRDIKPENILFAEPVPLCEAEGRPLRVKLIDLGMAGAHRDKVSVRGAAGTAGFMAPEIIRMEPHQPSMDMYSCGVLLFVMLTGRKPFRMDQTKSLYYSKLSIKDAVGLKDERYLALSDNAKSLLMALLADDPAARPTAAQALDHPFITQAAENKDAQREMGDLIQKRIQHMVNLRRVRGLRYALNTRAQGKTEEHFLEDLQKQRLQMESQVSSRMLAMGVEMPEVPDEHESYASYVRQSLAETANVLPPREVKRGVDMDACELLNQLPDMQRAHTLPAMSYGMAMASAAAAPAAAAPSPFATIHELEEDGKDREGGGPGISSAAQAAAQQVQIGEGVVACARAFSANDFDMDLLQNKSLLAQLEEQTGLQLKVSITAAQQAHNAAAKAAAKAAAAPSAVNASAATDKEALAAAMAEADGEREGRAAASAAEA